MTAWQAHLSWSHAALVLLAVLLIVGSLWCLIVARPRPARERRYWPLVDYAAARERQIAWLGERYLLAKPINRRAS